MQFAHNVLHSPSIIHEDVVANLTSPVFIYSQLHLRLNTAYWYCVTCLCGKTLSISVVKEHHRIITGSKKRLNRPILWRSMKSFTTNQC